MQMPWEISERSVNQRETFALVGIRRRDITTRYGTGRLRRFVGKPCPYCNILMNRDRGFASDEAPSRDHRIPISRGGQDIAANIIICCRGCNEEKSDLDEEEFAAVRAGLASSLCAWWQRLRQSKTPPLRFSYIHHARIRAQYHRERAEHALNP